jgi:hypothetical protein
MVYHAQKKDSNLLNTGRMEAITVFMRSRYVMKKGRLFSKIEQRYQTEHVAVIIQKDMIL